MAGCETTYCDRNVHWRCLLHASAMCEQQARLLIHSRDSPASSRLECGPHLCSCSSCMLQSCQCQNADVKMPMSGQLPVCTCCPFSDSLRLAPGSPSSIMTSSRCSNLHNIFLVLTAVYCGNLTDPVNGSVDQTTGTLLGWTANYSCNTGYNLEGNSTLTCQAPGNWSGGAPTCQGV